MPRTRGSVTHLPQERPLLHLLPADMEELCANQREKYKCHDGGKGQRRELAIHRKRKNVPRTQLINLKTHPPPAL